MQTLNNLWNEFLLEHDIITNLIKKQRYDELCALRKTRRNLRSDLQECIIELQKKNQLITIYLGGVKLNKEHFISINSLEQLQLFVDLVSMPHKITFGIDSIGMPTAYECASWLIIYCIENQIKFPDYVINSGDKSDALQMDTLVGNFSKCFMIQRAS